MDLLKAQNFVDNKNDGHMVGGDNSWKDKMCSVCVFGVVHDMVLCETEFEPCVLSKSLKR